MKPSERLAASLGTSPSDSELCSSAHYIIIDVFGTEIHVQRVPKTARTITVVMLSLGIIENGGFRYLFEGDVDGDPGYLITMAAYRAIGATEAHQAFIDAIAEFPKGRLPETTKSRDAPLEAFGEFKADLQFFAAIDDTVARLAKYIRDNADTLASELDHGTQI